MAKQSNALIKLGLFLFNPIIGLFVSLTQVKRNSSFLVFFLFCICFGISFVVPEDKNSGYTGDGVTYRLKFQRIAKYKTSEFGKLMKDYFEFDDGEKDFYAIASSFIVSRFTNNYHYIFGFYAAIFAFFLLKSLRFITREQVFKNTFYCILLALIFVMSNPIFNINGVRFWTAAWVGIYCLFEIFINKNKRFLILACLTPLIHVSFFVYLSVLLIAILFRHFTKFWIILFVLSFFISEVAFLLLESIENYLPEFLARVIRLYTDPEVMASKDEQRVWYYAIFTIPPRLIINLTVLFFVKNVSQIEMKPISFNIYKLILVWMTFVNFTMLVPALGGRFLQLVIPLIVYVWLTVFNVKKKKYKRWIIIFLLAFAAPYLYIFRLTLKVTELEFYFSNPFYLIYYYLV